MKSSYATRRRHARSAIRSCSRRTPMRRHPAAPGQAIDRQPRSSNTLASKGHNMDRRKFLHLAGIGAASPFFNLEALAQGAADRVLIVTEMNAEQPRHAHGRRQPRDLRRGLDDLRPADHVRHPHAAERSARATTTSVSSRSSPRAGSSRPTTRRSPSSCAARRHLPRRRADDGARREVVVRPLRQGRRLPAAADGAGFAHRPSISSRWSTTTPSG